MKTQSHLSNRNRATKLGLSAIIAALGGILVLYATANGQGLSPDSIAYIGAARNLASGHGLTVPFGEQINAPLTQHAPFYPIILFLLNLMGIEAAEGSRWLGVMLTVGIILLVALILKHSRPTSIMAPLVGAFFAMILPGLLGIYVMAWTEPLFILLGLAGFYALGNHIDRHSWIANIIGSLLIGLALLTRYSGVALVLAGAIGILLVYRVSFRRRILSMLAFILIPLLLFVIWSIRNLMASGTATNREIIFHPISRGQLWQGLTTVSNWFLVPSTIPTMGHLLIVLLITSLFVAMSIRVTRQSKMTTASFPGVIVLLWIFMPVYILFLVASITLFDANTPLDNRILSPILIVGVLVCVHLVDRYWELFRSRTTLFAVIVITTALGIAYAFTSLTFIHTSRLLGIGFASPFWSQSPIIAELQRLTLPEKLYSNAPEPVYYLAGMSASRLPRAVDLMTQKPNPNFTTEVLRIQEEVRTGQAIVVIINTSRTLNPNLENLLQSLDLVATYETIDGAIYTTKR